MTITGGDKTSKIIEYINPKLLKPDPNQPRQPDWNSPEEKEALQKLADSYHGNVKDQIWQIKADENNIIILGERRWRAALLAKLPKVKLERLIGLSPMEKFRLQMEDDEYKILHSEMDKAWAYGRWVANINSGKNFSLKELKAMDRQVLINLLALKKHDERGQAKQGTAELARQFKKNQKTIWNYLQCLYLETETQKMIGRGIPYTFARVVTRLHPDFPNAQSKIEQMLRDGDFRRGKELEKYVNDFLEKAGEEVKRRAKTIQREKPKETPKPPELSKEQIERLVRKEAEKPPKKTPFEKATNSLNVIQKKIVNAKKMNLDISEFERRFRDAKNNLTADPEVAYEEAKKLKKEIDETLREAKKSEAQKKREDQIRVQAEEEARQTLMKDKDFLRDAAEKLEKEGKEEKRGKTDKTLEMDIKDLVAEAIRIVDNAVSKLPTPKGVDTKKRKLIVNLMRHKALSHMLNKGDISCPTHGTEGTLIWSCCKTSIKTSEEKITRVAGQ